MADRTRVDVEPIRIEGRAALHVAVSTPIDLARAPAILGGEALDWLGARVIDADGPLRRYHCDLEVHLRGMAPIVLRKSALIGVGEPLPDAQGWKLALEWQAATLAPLFPVFVGSLWLRADRAVVDGHYAPPGGRLGQLADAVLLQVVARATARWLLLRITAPLTVYGT